MQRKLRVLWVQGTSRNPTSAHFLEAFDARCANGVVEAEFLDEAKYIPQQRSLLERIASRAIRRPIRRYGALNRAVVASVARFRPDVLLIAKGSLIWPQTLQIAKQCTGAVLVNWATDDPFNPAAATRNVRKSIPLFDLYVCTKRAIMADVVRARCPNVAYVMFGYKPTVHFPEQPGTEEEKSRFESDVAFIGACDSDRAPYFERLVNELPNLRLHLYGGYWRRYSKLRRYDRGRVYGREYRLALGGAKIVINLVRRANRDDHVQRTFELPACGAFSLAERTATHVEIFQEDREAVFFDSAEEMIAKVAKYLDRDSERRQIAEAGRRKIVSGRHTYGDRLDEILELSRQLIDGRRCSAAAAG